MRLEKRLFERFLKGVKEWLPSYYDSIVDTATIDDVGYKMGFDKEPAYIFDFELSDEKIKELYIIMEVFLNIITNINTTHQATF